MTGPAAAAGGVAGSWAAIDDDGSNMTLAVRGEGVQGRYAVTLHDDEATSACQGAPASAVGAGVAEGDHLWTRLALTCRPGGNLIRQRIDLSFTYDATAGTLTDSFGIVWTRPA